MKAVDSKVFVEDTPFTRNLLHELGIIQTISKMQVDSGFLQVKCLGHVVKNKSIFKGVKTGFMVFQH